MRRSRGIREIYDQVRDCDVVLTVDRALADGLNEVRGGPRLGTFATTPRELAKANALRVIGEEVVDEHVTVISISRGEGIDLRRAHSAWREHVELSEEDLPVDPIVDTGGLTLFDAMRRIGTTPLEGRVVGAVDIHHFTAMDLLMVPEDRIEVASLCEGTAPPMTLRRFPQRRQLVDWVVAGIDESTMEDVAIVISYRSPYLNLFNTALQERGIGVSTGGLLRDDLRVRGFLDMVACSLAPSTLTTGDVRAFHGMLGVDVPDGGDDTLLRSLARCDERASSAIERLDRLASSTWREATDMVRPPDELIGLIGSLGVLDETVDETGLEELRYLIDSFPMQIVRRSRGVALLDCLSSAFVNRPVCVMVGMDEGWSASAPDDPRLDGESHRSRDRERFVTLVQQGEVTERAIIDSDGVGEVRPCHHLCVEEGITSFSELGPMDEAYRSPGSKATIPHRIGEGRTVGLLSASSMNRYLRCPRMYMLEALVHGSDTPASLKGKALHEYLGVRAHGGPIDDAIREELLRLMLDTMSILTPEASISLMGTDLSLAMRSIDEHMDGLGDIEPFDGNVSMSTNSLMERLGMEARTGITELGFEDPGIGIKGSVDLYLRRGHMVDLKTGASRGLKDVAAGCIPSLFDDVVDVQPTAYLLWHRSVHGREAAWIDLFYCMHDRKAYVSGRKPGMGVSRRVSYVPMTLAAFLSTRGGWDRVCKWRKDNGSLLAAGVDTIASIVREHGCESVRVGRIIENDPMVQAMREGLPRYCEEILEAAIDMRRAGNGDEVLVFDDDLDDLESLIGTTRLGIEGCWRDGFPAGPRSMRDCSRCPHRDLCTEERT